MSRVLLVAVLLAIVVGALLPQVAMAQTVVDSSVDFHGTASENPQHHTFFSNENGYYYVFMVDSGQLEYHYTNAPKGDSGWTEGIVSTDCGVQGYHSEDYYNGSFYFVFQDKASPYEVWFMTGTPNGNGTLTFSSQFDTGMRYGNYVDIAISTTGYIFISHDGYSGNPGSPYYQYVLKSARTVDETLTLGWLTDSDTNILAGAGTEPGDGMASIHRLTGGKMVAVSGYGNAYYLSVRRYAGGWDTIVSSTHHVNRYEYLSAIPQDDYLHIAFNQSGSQDGNNNMVYVRYDGASNTFGSYTTLHTVASAADQFTPSISLSTTDNKVFILYKYNSTNIYVDWLDPITSVWTITSQVIVDGGGLAVTKYCLDTIYSTDWEHFGFTYTTSANTITKWFCMSNQFEVDTLTPTAVTDTQATLRGEIVSISWGNPSVRSFYINTSPTESGAAYYSESGTFSTGVFNRTIGGLSPETIYYYKSCASNAETICGEWVSFVTLAGGEGEGEEGGGNCTVAPSITTKAATYISMTSARLNALVNNAGCFDCTCSVYFQWYKSGGAWGDNQSLPVSGYHTGDTPYLNVFGLEGNTTYYFRALASNNCGNTTGNSLSFTTLTTLIDVSDFVAIPKVDEATIDLKWTWPTGAAYTVIRYKLGEYPGNTSDGTLVVQQSHSSGAAYAHEDLNPGDTLYYAAWGYDGNSSYSGTPDYAIATVTLAPTSGGGVAPTQPTNWFRDVNYTALSEMPGYGIINWSLDEFGINREFGWMGFGLVICILVFIIAYIFTKGNIAVAALITLVIMSVEVPMGIMAGFVCFIWAFVTAMYLVLRARA